MRFVSTPRTLRVESRFTDLEKQLERVRQVKDSASALSRYGGVYAFDGSAEEEKVVRDFFSRNRSAPISVDLNVSVDIENSQNVEQVVSVTWKIEEPRRIRRVSETTTHRLPAGPGRTKVNVSILYTNLLDDEFWWPLGHGAQKLWLVA